MDLIDIHKNVAQRKPDTKECILYESIYVKTKTRQNESVPLEVRIVVILVGSRLWSYSVS